MKHFLIVIAIALFLLGCTTPKYLYRLDLTPTVGESSWKDGIQKTQVSSSNCQFSLGYNGIKDGYLEFDVTIKNTGRDTITIDPMHINYKVIALINDTSKRTQTFSGNCVDPESTIQELAYKRRTVESERNPYTKSGLELGLDLAVATVDLFSLFSKDTKTQSQKDKAALEREKREYDERKRKNNESQWNINHENQIYDLDQKIEFFKKKSLRRTTLLPSETVSGLFYCNYYKNAKTVDFTLSINGVEQTIQYKQDEFYR